MRNIQFDPTGRNIFILSFTAGTGILLGYLVTGNYLWALFGFYYTLAAGIINLLFFFSELIAFISDRQKNKARGNSAALILINIPAVLLYLFIISKT